MRVIFLQHVAGQGEKGQVKEVSDGYARNMLLPRGLAVPATAERLRKLEAERRTLAKEDEAAAKRLAELARKLSGTTLEFKLKGDDRGSVFGSVSKDAILKALREHGLATHDRVEIALDHPLKEFGDHEVKASFHKSIQAALKVRVSRAD